MHVGAGRELTDALAPVGKDFVAFAPVAAKADRAADMIEADRRLRESARQIDEVAELWMVDPGIEAEAEGRQLREAFTHALVEQQAHRPNGGSPPSGLIGIHGGDVADATEPATARYDHGLQHLFHRRA